MANQTILDLPAAGVLTGAESVPIVQAGITVRTTTAAIAASPSLTQTFLTLNNEPTLPNSRYFSVGTGLGLTDNGAQSNLVLSLNGASGSLETASNGFAVKTGLTTVVGRTLTTSGNGLAVTNGNGVSGNPVFALTGLPEALANLPGGGFLVSVDPSTIAQRSITGVANQISVVDGNGLADNPEIGIANNAVFPGTAGVVLPSGGTGQRSGSPINGTIRYNTDTLTLEGYTNNTWGAIAVGAGVTSVNVSGGTTGLTTSGGPITSAGTITFAGTLITANGGTGLSSYAAGDIIYYTAGDAFTRLTIGSAGQVLTSTGSDPQWSTLSGVAVTTFSAGTTGFAPSVATSGAVTLSGTLIADNGGTGISSYAAGDLLYYSAGTALTKLPIGSAAQILTSTGTAPQWSTLSGVAVTTFSGGSTGLTPNIATAGAITLAGTLNVANGGTGANSLTGYVKGSGTAAFTASSTIPNTDITGLGTMSTQSASNVAITGGAINGTTVGATTPAAGTFTSVAMTSGTITTAPSTGNDIVNKTYADSIAAGINFHQSCRLATTTALPSCTYNNGTSGVGATLTATANGALSVDTTPVASTNRILVKNQSNQAHNGVYVVTQAGDGSNPFILTRATDFDTPGTGVNQIDAGDFFLITAGSTLANTSWVQQTPLPITVGTTGIVFSQFGAPLTYSAGTGLSESPAYTFNIANTGVVSGSYGSASSVPTLSINAQGQVTSATNTSIAIAASQVTSGQLAIAQGGTNGNATPTAGAVPYGTGTAYAFSLAGTTSQVLLSGGTATPTWADQSSLSVGSATTATTATNVAGGATGSILYQSAASTTTSLALGTTNFVLTAGASAPQYVDQSTLSVGSATNATNTAITDDTSTNATVYPTWVTANTGNLPQKVTSTKLTFNPSTGVLTATGGISGGTF